jgi:NAD dependent epimerase/dehydratase
MNWRNKEILVTGAGGFIGSHLTEDLVKLGARVRAMVHYNSRSDWGRLEALAPDTKAKLEIIPGDIRDAFWVKEAVRGCEIVFHLASLIAIPYSYTAPQSYVSTNINGTLNVLQACREERTPKVVHTSTSETYGTARYVPIDEGHPLQSQSPYSATKIAADKMAESFHRSFGLPVVILRPFNTYGPRQSARAVIPTIISQALSQNVVELGSLEPVRDLTFVKDTVTAFVKAAEIGESVGEVINIGSGKGIQIGALAKLVAELLEKNIQINHSEERERPKESEVWKLVCDASKAKQLLGWKPGISIREGLKTTIQYIRENLNQYKTDAYNV